MLCWSCFVSGFCLYTIYFFSPLTTALESYQLIVGCLSWKFRIFFWRLFRNISKDIISVHQQKVNISTFVCFNENLKLKKSNIRWVVVKCSIPFQLIVAVRRSTHSTNLEMSWHHPNHVDEKVARLVILSYLKVLTSLGPVDPRFYDLITVVKLG